MHNKNNYEALTQLRRIALASIAGIIGFSTVITPYTANAVSKPCSGVIKAMYDNDTSSKTLHGCSSDQTSPLSLDIDAKAVPVAASGYDIKSGKVIYLSPNGNDANPGTKDLPMQSIKLALDYLPAIGGTLVLYGGTYVQGNAGTNKPNVTIQPYKNDQVWLDGAAIVRNFKKSGSTYTVDWTEYAKTFCSGHFFDVPLKHQIKEGNAGPCAHYDNSNNAKNPMAVDPIMVFKDGKYIHEVQKLSQAKGDNFYVDQDTKHKTAVIHLGFKPSGHTVEITKYPSALKLSGDGDTIRGIGFKRFGSNEYDRSDTYSSVYMSGTNGTVRDSVFTQMAAVGLFINGRGGRVSHSVFASNGFNGVNANGHRESDRKTDSLTIENNLVYNNNTELFSTNASISSSRAGSKIANMNSFTVRNNIFYKNNGYGFWCDNDCTYGNVIQNTFINNVRGGIVYEVSSHGIIASNLIAGKSEFGIRNCSADTKIYNNTIVGSFGTTALWIYDDLRYATQQDNHIPGLVGPDTRNVEVVNNIVYNDKRVVDITTGDLPKEKAGSTNTPLNQLLSKMDYNEYYATGKYYIPDGTPEHRSKFHGAARTLDSSNQNLTVPYRKVSDMRSGKNTVVTSDGKAIDPHALYGTSKNGPFVSFSSRNFTVKTSDAGYTSGTKLPADVAAQLGVSTSTTYSRGAINWPGME